MTSTTKSENGDEEDKKVGKSAMKEPRTKIRVVVKKRRRHHQSTPSKKAKPGLPNLTKELTEAPASDLDDDESDGDFFLPLEDAIPCDTLLAFQSLTQMNNNSPQQSLHIPLQASLEPVPCILESQLVSALQQNEQDHDSLAMVAQELPELLRKNTLRRMASVSAPGGGGADLNVLLLTSDYIRGVWDAHDTTESPDSSSEDRELCRAYVQWFVDHLHRWTGRVLMESQLQRTWTRRPPKHNLPYATLTSFTKALGYLQQIQVLLAQSQHQHQQRETTYQLWLPQWGTVLSAVQTAQTKMIRKLQQSYQKELSEKTFLQQPLYHGVSTRLLLQLLQDQGKILIVPKPFGNFIQLVQKKQKGNKRKR